VTATTGNGNGHAHGNGHGNGNGQRDDTESVARNGARFEPCDADHLGGFADFPNAEARPKVRWG
jgi:hypothetical protein